MSVNDNQESPTIFLKVVFRTEIQSHKANSCFMVCHYAVIFVSFKPIYLSVCGSTPCTESLNQRAFKLPSEEAPFPAHPCSTRQVWIYIYCTTRNSRNTRKINIKMKREKEGWFSQSVLRPFVLQLRLESPRIRRTSGDHCLVDILSYSVLITRALFSMRV